MLRDQSVFAGIKIQSATHDSIEDARTALKLYQKFAGLTDAARLLIEMYEAGEKAGWLVVE